jgi:hypothetical protein
MALPKQVTAQLAELEELEKSLQGDTGQTAEPEQPVEAVQAEPQVAPEPVPAEPVQEEKRDELWEHRYRRLQGKYDAEVPRLHAALREMELQVEQLKQELKAKPTEEVKQKESVKLVTAADVDNFGDDLIDLQRRVAREVAAEFADQIEALRAENAALKKQVGETGAKVGEVSFKAQLDQAIPDFATVNADKRWIAWLDGIDPMVRGPRRSVVQAAWDRGDIAALAEYVALWKQGINGTTNGQRQGELRRQVQPSRTVGAQATSPGTDKTYTDAEARGVFEQVRRLNARGSYDAAAKLEAEISRAYLEGRVMA